MTTFQEDNNTICDKLPKHAAALVINRDGDVSFIIPSKESLSASDDDRVPNNVLAITELAMRMMDGDLKIDDLASAMRNRTRS